MSIDPEDTLDFNTDNDIQNGIEGILKAFFPNVSTRKIKSTDTKVVKTPFSSYRIKYFTRKTADGFECHINLINVPTEEKFPVAKKLTLRYSSKNKLLVAFIYGNIYIEDTLVLDQTITASTVLKYHQTRNKVLVIAFKN